MKKENNFEIALKTGSERISGMPTIKTSKSLLCSNEKNSRKKNLT